MLRFFSTPFCACLVPIAAILLAEPALADDSNVVVLNSGSYESGYGPIGNIRRIGDGHLFLELPYGLPSEYPTDSGSRVWDWRNGKLVYGNPFDARSLKAIDFDPVSNRVIVKSKGGNLEIRSAVNSLFVVSLPIDSDVGYTRFVDNGRKVLFNGTDRFNGSLRSVAMVVDAASGKLLWESLGLTKTGDSTSYRFRPDTEQIYRLDRIKGSNFELSYELRVFNLDGSAATPPLESIAGASGLSLINNFLEEETLFGYRTLDGKTLLVDSQRKREILVDFDLGASSYYYRMSPNGKYAAFRKTSGDSFILIDLESGAFVANLVAERSKIGQTSGFYPSSWFDFNPEGTILFVADRDGNLSAWNTAPFGFDRSLGENETFHLISAITPDGERFVALAPEFGIEFLSVSDCNRESTIETDYGSGYARFLDSETLLVSESSGRVTLYTYPGGERIRSIPEQPGLQIASRFIDSREKYLSVFKDGTFTEIDPSSGTLTRIARRPNASSVRLDMDAASGRALFWSLLEGLSLFDPYANAEVWKIPAPFRSPAWAASRVFNDISLIAVSGEPLGASPFENRLNLYRSDSPDPIRSLLTYSPVATFDFSPDGAHLAYSDVLYNLLVIETIGTVAPRLIAKSVENFAFAADGQSLVALQLFDGFRLKLQRYTFPSGDPVGPSVELAGSFHPFGSPFGVVALSPDGQTAAVSIANHLLSVVDLSSGKEVARKLVRPRYNGSVSFINERYHNFLSFDSTGKRFLFQDAFGHANDWRIDQADLVPLAPASGPPYPTANFIASPDQERRPPRLASDQDHLQPNRRANHRPRRIDRRKNLPPRHLHHIAVTPFLATSRKFTHQR